MIIKRQKYKPAPEGSHDAVCVDAVEMPDTETKFGKKDLIRVVWEIPERMEDGRRFTVSKRYNASINEKSTFFKDMKTWFGRGPEHEFDTEGLVGKPCQIVVQHDEKDGNTYANVMVVMKPGATRLEPSADYVRVKDREQRNGNHDEDEEGTPF